MINGLCTKCIDSVVRLYANVSCNILNIIPYAGSVGAGCLTITCVMVEIAIYKTLHITDADSYKTNVQ